MTDLANDLSNLSQETKQFLDCHHGLLINGQWVRPHRQSIPVLDPTSARQVSSLSAGNAVDINHAVDTATRAFETTRGSFGLAQRERVLSRFAGLVESNARRPAELESIDVGMPIRRARNLDVTGAVAAIRYMAGWPSKISGRTAPFVWKAALRFRAISSASHGQPATYSRRSPNEMQRKD